VCPHEVFYDGDYRKGLHRWEHYILSDSQAAIKALDSVQINSKLVWDCQKSLVKLAEHSESNWYGCQDTRELMEMK
jgi:hypothetical protein